MHNKRGDVVLLDYPFTDRAGSPLHPALVVQSDCDNTRLPNTVVALITETIQRASTEPTQFLIDIATPEGRESGLRVTSTVTCTNLHTVQERHIIQTIGRLHPTLLKQLNRCLQVALQLR